MRKSTSRKEGNGPGPAANGARKPLALGHPVRWELVREVSFHGPLAVGDLADRLGVERPALSGHLPQLLEAGIVEVFPDPMGDARKRFIGLARTVVRSRSANVLEVDFGEIIVRFNPS